jgi:uncharacterized protein (TIGR02246 family)
MFFKDAFMLRKWNAVIVMIAAALVMSIGNAQCEDKNRGSVAAQDDAVRNVLMNLEKAVGAKNVDAISALFADDVHFIDQAGDELQGQKAIRQRFDTLFKTGSVPVIGIHPQSITFPADNVALVIGEVSRKVNQDHLPASRFSMVLIKKPGGWIIQESTETVIQAAQTANHLHELNWLIGQWSVNNADASAEMNVEWAPGKKFIISKSIIKKTGKSQETDNQVIGWDPQHNTIISWHFDSNGGFGHGIWSRRPDERTWTVNVVGVGADGSNNNATNIFSLKAADEFSWQSIHRSLDGTPVVDTEPFTIHRVKR